MKKTRILLIALILTISGFYGNLYAQQSIYVEETDGSITATPLTQVKKITFAGGNMLLHKTDATTITWATADVQKYYYALYTNVEPLKISESNDVLIYPNPSNGSFNISYQVNEKGKVNISILSIDGKLIKTVLSEQKEKGDYSLDLTENLELGSYFVKIASSNSLIVKKIIILK